MANNTTVYWQVADTLRRRILSGKLQPGEILPPERELCEQFATSRITIRRALQILAEDMLVIRRQGSGTYVSATPSRKIPLLNADFVGSLSVHAPDISRRLDGWEWQAADEQIAALLQVRPSTHVLFARRFDILDGNPVAYDDVHLLEQVADRISANDLAELSFLQCWQEVQKIRIGHIHQSVEASAADKVTARRLGQRTGSPILKEVAIVYLATGAACGVFFSYYRHDLFRLTSTVKFTQNEVPGNALRLETLSNTSLLETGLNLNTVGHS